MELTEVALWAFRQNYHADHMNAAIHCAEVRYSPLTFRLAEALADHLEEMEAAGSTDWGELNNVLTDRGRYAEDPGR